MTSSTTSTRRVGDRSGSGAAWSNGRPLPATAYAAMDRAARSLGAASRSTEPADRFLAAHVSALQVVAAVLAVRGRPGGRGRTLNAWLLLERVAPELSEWATYFSAGAPTRAGIEAGLDHLVSSRDSLDLLAAADAFFHEVAGRLGLTPSVLLGAAGYLAA